MIGSAICETRNSHVQTCDLLRSDTRLLFFFLRVPQKTDAQLKNRRTAMEVQDIVSKLPFAHELLDLVQAIHLAFGQKQRELAAGTTQAKPEKKKHKQMEIPPQSLVQTFLNFFADRGVLTGNTARFVLESYLFILKASPAEWQEIDHYTREKSGAMNQDIEMLQTGLRQQPRFSTWYSFITRPDLPMVPPDLLLYRCIYTRESFDVLNMQFFDNYRVLSTSVKEGRCADPAVPNQTAIQAEVRMVIRPRGLKGLLLVFPTYHQEFELILPPGVRLTWDQEADLALVEVESKQSKGPTHDIAGERVTVEPESFFDLDTMQMSQLHVHYRVYDATFIPRPDATQFPSAEVAARVKNLQKGIAKMNAVFQQHRRERIRRVLVAGRERARRKIHEQALQNTRELIAQEERRLLREAEERSTRVLPRLMRDALDSERHLSAAPSIEERAQVAKKFLRAELAYQDCVGRSLENRQLLKEFQSSARALKYSPGLAQHRLR